MFYRYLATFLFVCCFSQAALAGKDNPVFFPIITGAGGHCINSSVESIYFKNLVSIDFTPASFTVLPNNKIRILNVRAKSDRLDPADYLMLTARFDINKKSLWIDSLEAVEDIGVFNSPYFAKDVSSKLRLYNKLSSYEEDYSYSITSSGENYAIQGEVGQVLSFLTKNPSADFIMKVKDPKGEIIYNYYHNKSDSGVISSEIPFFTKGVYTVNFTPVNTSSVNFGLYFLNANNHSMVQLKNGDTLSASFKNNIRDYAKYKIYLNKNERATLSDSGDDIRITVFDSHSAELSDSTGLSVTFEANSSGYYYIFIDNKKGWGGSYYGSIKVSSKSNSSNDKDESTITNPVKGGATSAMPN